MILHLIKWLNQFSEEEKAEMIRKAADQYKELVNKAIADE